MKKAITGILVAGMAVSMAGAQSLTKVPVHGKPVWQVVTGATDAPGAPVPARSLSTNQIMGYLPVDYKFQSFGTNGQIITLGMNGELVYVPSSTVTMLYPTMPKPEIAPRGPDTLETLAEQYEKRMTGVAGVSLDLSDSLASKAEKRQAAVAGANPAMPGTNFAGPSVDPYAGQPGAALMNGGIPALGAMAGAPERK